VRSDREVASGYSGHNCELAVDVTAGSLHEYEAVGLWGTVVVIGSLACSIGLTGDC
jgi:hypothetical protein